MTLTALPPYHSHAARALVLLHEQHLRKFVTTWRQARDADGRLTLPITDDPSYSTLDTLLEHVLASARQFMYWMCEHLGLPDPEIQAHPKGKIEDRALDAYLDHLFARWAMPLAGKSDNELYEYVTPHKPCYASAMLEHAVMHPIRHGFQLEELMGMRK